jgi:threonine/homoserine/homoserine lactone efflux protein
MEMVGFGLAVPIGPAVVLCVRKTLAEGRARGLTIGLGAATADSLCGTVAAFGLTLVSDVIAAQAWWMRPVGGGVLLVLGLRTFLARRRDPAVPRDTNGLLGTYVAALLLALTNPVTVVAFAAVFAALGLGYDLAVPSAAFLVVGVFTGSLLWFLTLGSTAMLFRKRLDVDGFGWVNRIAGLLIILSGVAAVVSLL